MNSHFCEFINIETGPNHSGNVPLSTATIIIIGDEILTAKVRDENAHYMATEFRKLGVSVRRIATIPDELDEIAAEVRAASDRTDYVVTTGGVGPTHDDVTMAGVARGFNVPVVRHPELEKWLREWYGDRINETALKMSEVPDGARIILRPGLRFPPVVFRNVYILPGVPQFLKDKFAAIADEFTGSPLYERKIFVRTGETAIAETLRRVVAEFPEVAIGSYPVVDRKDYRVRVTLETVSEGTLQDACARLTELLGDDVLPGPE